MTAKIIIRAHDSGFWGTVRLVSPETSHYVFSYDTAIFKKHTEALDECRAFCKWKGLRVVKIVKEV